MRHLSTKWVLLAVAGLCVASPSCSCGGDLEGDPTGTNASGSGAGGTAAGGGGFGGGGDGGNLPSSGNGTSAGGGGEGGACAQILVETVVEVAPPDIIFIVGNNGSLAQEIAAVEENINANFAQIIEQSGIDYRVILVSRSGAHQFNMCVEAPLGGVPAGQCAAQTNNAQPVNNPGKFFHYSAAIGASDPWCRLLAGFDGTVPDEYGLAPGGWSEWLRPEAHKIFVIISDSSTKCTFSGTSLDDGPQQPNMSDIPGAEAAAAKFDDLLLGLSPQHFGTAATRTYQWNSIVGLSRKDLSDPTAPWLPGDPLSLVKCTGDTNPVSPALGYQALSRLTGGLRFPICEWQNFDVVFAKLAQNIISSVDAISCDFALPEPPEGETLDPSTVQMKFSAPGESPKDYNQVAGPDDCAADAFFILDDTIFLCPETCAEVQEAGDTAELDIAFGCELPKIPVPD